ncbi:hypothetical protein BDN70DRAFT_821316 [Pholiota conissans]|uniref:Uncharacterized protein n=1 Tax=Pholiota conissans TaxID=109636 RepID=A0A9P6CSD5_9AGAR|nr:hypothetical protein BDN70DRAFT_821316 [Pholiota conissans]
MTTRLASSIPEGTQKKASDALASASATALRVLQGVQKALGPLGDKAGNLLGSYKQPLLYNLAVTRELAKQIYIKEGLQPPSFATVREVYTNLAKQVRAPGYIGSLLKSGEVGRIGVYGLQAYGIFKIGEIVGRRHVVGYKLD